MKVLVLVVIVVTSEASRSTREVTHPKFPNLRTVHHGHGATSYQNVQVENHDVPIPRHDSTVEYLIDDEQHFEHDAGEQVIQAIEFVPIHSEDARPHYIISIPTTYIQHHVDHIEEFIPYSAFNHHDKYIYEDYEFT